MSRIVDKALEAVEQSKFKFIDERTLEVNDAFIFWTNFSGRENRFGNTAKTFNLAISEAMKEQLEAMGWRVREVSNNDEENEQLLYFVNIKINMNSSYPPLVNLYSEFRGNRNKTSLTDETISQLDLIEIKTADCLINAYESRNYPGKVSGYLKKLNVIQEPNVEFGGKYDDWMDESREETLDEPGTAFDPNADYSEENQ